MKLGQHFLRDTRILRRIIDAADLQPNQRVLEIGPGPGNVTEELARAGGNVTAVEADPNLARPLVGKWPNVDIVEGDAVQVPLEGHFDRIVTNLPYQISGPFTIRLLEMSWDRTVMMVQKEFADRLLAEAGSKAYGRLTAHVRRRLDVEQVCHVSRAAFAPPPKVQSTVLLLTPRADPIAVKDEALWTRIVDQTFAQRRKQLRNTLPQAAGPRAVEVLEKYGWASARPEDLRPEDFATLVAELA